VLHILLAFAFLVEKASWYPDMSCSPRLRLPKDIWKALMFFPSSSSGVFLKLDEKLDICGLRRFFLRKP